MRRTFLSIAIASTVGLAAAGSAWAQAPLKKVTIVIGSPGLIYSLHYVAVGAGLFAAEGLDVETVQVSSGTQQIAAVLGGSAIVAPTCSAAARGAVGRLAGLLDGAKRRRQLHRLADERRERELDRCGG